MVVGIIAVAITAAVAIVLLSQHRPAPAQYAGHRGVSPLDEAERILAHRYARREIDTEEYERMLSILRR
jgi:uncharacterized membrane protein